MIMRIYYLYLLLFITHLPLIAIPTCHIFFEQPDTRSHVYRIPDYNAHYHHHSYETKENLFVYSSGQLQHYFDCNHYSEKDILSQNVLYISDEFVQFAKTYPGSEQSITKLHHKLAKLSWFQKTYHWLVHGSYCPTLFKRVQRLYKEVKQYQQLTNTPAKSFAHLYNINLMALLPSQKPIASYNIYKDYIDILEQAYSIPVHNVVIRDCIGKASHIGLEANKYGLTKQASQLADFCHTIIDCAKAFGEGIYLGTVNTIETIIHPVETVKNSIIGIGVITHALSKLVSIPAECVFLYATDTDHYYIRKNEIINQLETLVDKTFNYLYTTQKRDFIKQGVSILTEGALLTKIFIFAHNLSKNLLPLTKSYFEYVIKKEPLACLANGTMIKVAIPKNINTKPLNDTILKIESSQLLSQNIGQHTSTISHTIQEIFTAIAEIEPNRIHHILTPTTEKHAWCKVCKNPLDWEEVKNIIAKVMLEGDIKQKKHGYEKIFTINKENIVVRYIYKSDGTLSISNAWVII